ncbi:hypothetical protein Tco_0665751, partial [Tanacetum coccineum]
QSSEVHPDSVETGLYSITDIAMVLCLELFQSTALPFKTKTYPV